MTLHTFGVLALAISASVFLMVVLYRIAEQQDPESQTHLRKRMLDALNEEFAERARSSW